MGDALNLLGEELANASNNREHLEKVLDGLLDEDEDPEEDQEIAAEWERSRRE